VYLLGIVTVPFENNRNYGRADDDQDSADNENAGQSQAVHDHA
jgi:hypothetical protein